MARQVVLPLWLHSSAGEEHTVIGPQHVVFFLNYLFKVVSLLVVFGWTQIILLPKHYIFDMTGFIMWNGGDIRLRPILDSPLSLHLKLSLLDQFWAHFFNLLVVELLQAFKSFQFLSSTSLIFLPRQSTLVLWLLLEPELLLLFLHHRLLDCLQFLATLFLLNEFFLTLRHYLEVPLDILLKLLQTTNVLLLQREEILSRLILEDLGARCVVLCSHGRFGYRIIK